MLFSIFIFGCMQDEPIVDRGNSQSEAHTVQELKTKQDFEIKKEIKPVVVETSKTVIQKDTSSTEPLVSAEKIKKPEEEEKKTVALENPVEEPQESENEQLKTKEEVAATPQTASTSVSQIEEKPKVKKKVQYSKPNQMCVSKIKKVLKSKNGEISYCYDMQKFKNPTLEGSITVQINVHKSRNSIWVKRDTMKDKGFRSCMKSKIRDWDFGPDCYGASFKKSYKLVSG